MSIDKVQLQQQEVVDNGVVKTDINPITSTSSVIDISSGSTMQETLDRIWDAVNSQLSRIVNSVNNRTGAVVIDANDVGLGNVDNVSFNDIKEWVIEYIKSLFDDTRLRLYNNLQEVRNDANTNDESLHDAPFFSEHGDGSDLKSYIGYFYWEDGGLSFESRAINTVGSTDLSINYDEYVGPDKDFSGGMLGVNIHPDEDALYLHQGQTRYQSGLKIDKSKLRPDVMMSRCLYGELDNTTSMLSAFTANNGASITIYIDDVLIDGTHYLNKNWDKTPKVGDIVFTEFERFYDLTLNPDGVTSSVVKRGPNANFSLMDNEPGYGVFTSVPDILNPDTPYVIRFYTIKTNVSGFGLQYYDNHQDTNAPNTQLGVSLSESSEIDESTVLSGIQAISGPINITNDGHTIPFYSRGVKDTVTTPWFRNKIDGGMYIKSDESISIYPEHLLQPQGDIVIDIGHDINGEYEGSKLVKNWAEHTIGGWDPNTITTGLTQKRNPALGFAGSQSLLSVNLRKRVKWGNYRLLENMPSTWSSTYNSYYKRDGGITDNFTMVHVDKTAPPWETNHYYERSGDDYILTTVQPEDWESNYYNYYYRITDSSTGTYVYYNVRGVIPIWEPYKYYEKIVDDKKYIFQNLSGLKSTTLTANEMYRSEAAYPVPDPTSSTLIQPEPDRVLSRDELEDIGIYDGKNATGEAVDNEPYSHTSGGLSVNVGKFLEINPKTTSRGSKYYEGGRLQVRVGYGLKEDIQYTDYITYDDIESGDVDPDTAIAPFDWDDHPERYALKLMVGGQTGYNEISDMQTYIVLTEEPVNWNDNYIGYYFKDSTTGEYFKIPKSTTAPTFVADRYYMYTTPGFNRILNMLNGTFYVALCNVVRTNRIVANTDGNTVDVDRIGRLVSYPVIDYAGDNKVFSKNQILKYNDLLYLVLADFQSTGNFEEDSVNLEIIGENNVDVDVDNQKITIGKNEFNLQKSVTELTTTDEESKYKIGLKLGRTLDIVYPNTHSTIGVGLNVNLTAYGMVDFEEDTGGLDLRYDNKIFKRAQYGHSPLLKCLGLKYGTTLTTSDDGLEVNYDNGTIIKNSAGALRVAIDNETIKGESTINGALAVRYGTSLTKTSAGLEVKVDGTTITKNSSGALVATPASSAVRIDGSTLKRDSNNTMYVDIDDVSLKMFTQGDSRAAIGVNLDNTTIGLNADGALCVLNSGGGGGGGSIAVDGTTIQNGVNGLYANLDQQTLVVNQDSHISTNIDGRYDATGSIFRAFGHAKPYEAGQRYFMGELIYTRASESSPINAVYIARATITADGNINTDIAAGYIGLIVSF